MEKQHIIVSTFPPKRCGIAKYAAQQAQWLRTRGVPVKCVGLLPESQGDVNINMRGGMRARQLEPLARQFPDARLIVHWHDGFYYAGGYPDKLPTDIALQRAFDSFAEVEIICHEIYEPEAAQDPIRSLLRERHVRARQALWRSAARVYFFSEADRRRAETALGTRLDDERVEILPHHAFFTKDRDISQEEARRELEIPAADRVFLCIGFVLPTKGYHRALEAFAAMEPGVRGRARLYIVGAVRDPNDELAVAYAAHLREKAGVTPGAHVVEQYVSDADFDTWMSACDSLVIPYENAFSSSVIERAHLFGKQVIARDVGGLGSQLRESDRTFLETDALTALMEESVRSAHRLTVAR